VASVLSLIAGLVVGALAGWWWRGRSIAPAAASTQTSVPAQSSAPAETSAPAESGERVPALVGASAEGTVVPSPAPVPAAETIPDTSSAADKPSGTGPDLEPVAAAAPAPVAEVTPTAENETVADEKPIVVEDTVVVVAEPIDEETVVVVAEETIVVAEPVAVTEPAAAAEPVAVDEADLVTEGTPVPDVEQIVAEPEDLTKIAGIGPKMAMALAASGITTFAQLAETPVEDIRKAVAAAGMRLAPTIATWPEQARTFAGR
jgi:predicted flap endonuclease-1-like 5' DNA nuclease